MATAPPAPPESGGNIVTRKVGPFPVWVWLVGVGGIALFLRARSAKPAAQQVLTGPVAGGMTTDPATGHQIDPFTGLPLGGVTATTMSLQDWITAAYKAATAHGVNPALANKALYDYSNGNTLTDQEANALSKILGWVGMPPVTLPFFGNIPPTPAPVPPVVRPPILGPPAGGGHGHLPHPKPQPTDNGGKMTPLAGLPATLRLQPGEHIVDAVRGPGGESAGYYLTNLGGVFSVGGAKSYGSFLGLPQKTRAGIGDFVSLIVNPGGGYTEIAQGGQRYTFDPATLKRKVGV